MPLTALAIQRTKPSNRPIKLSDGGGLYLLIKPNGGRYWRMAYRYAGKQKDLALGVCWFNEFDDRYREAQRYVSSVDSKTECESFEHWRVPKAPAFKSPENMASHRGLGLAG